MDLKRAWRNGFLVSLIFAIPLSDQYYNQYSNLSIDSSAATTRIEHASAGLAAGTNDEFRREAISWDNSVDENGLTIPGSTLTSLLLEPDDTDFGDIQKTEIQFDPQDIFLFERAGEVDLDAFGSPLQNRMGDFGPLTSPSYGFGNPSANAHGFSGPITPGMFAPGGKTASAETLFFDSRAGSSTQTETGNESLHSVPEPSSFLLITIGTISIASLMHRKSKLPAAHS